MGRRPSKVVDIVELELMLGHTTFFSFLNAVEVAAGRMVSKSSMRVYWSYHRRYVADWRQAMKERRPLDPSRMKQWAKSRERKAEERQEWERRIRAGRSNAE